jgi:NADPH-dependent glutamate synthase beta subunit-like oxidoreductase/ferredoxin
MNALLEPRTTWTTGSTESLKTGTWRAALPQHIHAPSPCHAACPVGGEIAEWIGQAGTRDFRAAWRTLTRHNPFPAIAGRICHHPCESACNRAGFDEPLAICKLERFVGDLALERGWAFDAPTLQRRERVAIVGGGPSGLSAAFQLRRRGYPVTLFESRDELGGLMRYGIPPYRLARAVLDGEIARIVALGVDVRCGQPLATPAALASLRAQYDAVYLAFGAQRQKRLPQLDYARTWVVDGADYLARSSLGAPPPLGRRVVVVGGGSAALDVARSARRAGHEVTILALEAERDLPAQRDEVVEALEEGIALVDGSMLRAAVETGAGAVRLDCVRVRFEAGAQRGQFTITPLDGSDFRLEAEAVVSSIGQDPELSLLDAAFDRDGALLAIDGQGETPVDGVWAGGDLASLARFVTEAVGMGRRAALAIDQRLGRRRREDGDAAVAVTSGEALVELAAINLHYHPSAPRAPEWRRSAAARLAPGSARDAEVQLGLALEAALAEAGRCFSCGTCTHCDNCVTYCPDLAVRRAGDGYEVLGDYCKGCGVCVKECPTGSMRMQEEAR